MYCLYYLILGVNWDLCAAYLYYFAALTQIIRALEARMQLVPAMSACHPSPLKIQWWCFRLNRPPSIIDPTALPCPHWVQPTNQDCQDCPSKLFFNPHAKRYEPVLYFLSDYLPLQAIIKPTCQALWASPVVPHHITCPSKPFLNRHAKHCKPVPSLLIRFIVHQWLLYHKAIVSASDNASSAAFFTSC